MWCPTTVIRHQTSNCQVFNGFSQSLFHRRSHDSYILYDTAYFIYIYNYCQHSKICFKSFTTWQTTFDISFHLSGLTINFNPSFPSPGNIHNIQPGASAVGASAQAKRPEVVCHSQESPLRYQPGVTGRVSHPRKLTWPTEKQLLHNSRCIS